MNIDFHYYGTYVAARLAGLNFKEAQTIAHCAQYVDDSSLGTLDSSCTPGFNPVPTTETFAELAKSDTSWSDENLNRTFRTWTSFHFLPANYGSNTSIVYTGPHSDKGTYFDWEYDVESNEQFKLLCLPNSPLVSEIINDIVQNHRSKDYILHIIGLRMHVMADTWAHCYFAGIPAWFINDTLSEVWDITDPSNVFKIKWNAIWPLTYFNSYLGLEDCSPRAPSYNSYVYLGHGRMGHLPDFPYIKYQYTPEWTRSPIVKDNRDFCLKAFKQMITAMRSIRENKKFLPNTYENLDPNVEKIVISILNTRAQDQRELWKKNIGNIKINNVPLEVPEEYDSSKWLTDAKKAPEKTKTDYYYFNYSALLHLNLIKNNLKNELIFIDGTPVENTLNIRLKNQDGPYIGPMETVQVNPANNEYCPTLSDNSPVTLSIIKSNNNILKSGDIVKIKTLEPKTGENCYLGAWSTSTLLYYYLRDYDITKQKWQIIKLDISKDTIIRSGDAVIIKNVHFKKVPYISSYASGSKKYLTTTKDISNQSKWSLIFV